VRRLGVVFAASIACAIAAPAALANDITLHVVSGKVDWGSTVRFSGSVTPAAPGEAVYLVIGSATVARTALGADGSFAGTFRALHAGALTAHSADGSASASLALGVRPVLHAHLVAKTLFAPAHLVVRAKPSSGVKLHFVVIGNRGRKLIAHRSWAHGGRLTVPFAADGTRLTAYVSGSIGDGPAASAKPSRLTIDTAALGPGSHGPAVLGLKRRLASLTYHQDDLSSAWSAETSDAVLAFQKAEGLARTALADRLTLAHLARASVPRARYGGKGLHIEIDKARQILQLVRDGKVTGTLHVSTGATGNTPLGHWSVLWKAPSTHTWLGPAILYRTMTFHGGFAIHGFSPVPAYPASHGCVREPIWAADWTYEQTPVGTAVDVY
jgi:L,D-transpeptidase catalytic domain/Putative peptidoglycan binding domain